MIKKNDSPRKVKKSNVVPINQATSDATDQARVIASDPSAHRVVFAIGRQRVAYDFTARITELPPTTGDQPAPVLPMKAPSGNKRTRDNRNDAA
jgi:hypothetical protein